MMQQLLIGLGAAKEHWIALIGGSSSDEGRDIDIDSNGNVFVVGKTSSDGEGSDDAFIVKLDDKGAIQWQRTLGGSASDRFEGCVIHSDDIYAVGATYSEGSGSTSLSANLTVKYNNSGTLQWQKVTGDNRGNDYSISVDIDSSNILRTAGTIVGGDNTPNIGVLDFDTSGGSTRKTSETVGSNKTDYGSGCATYGGNAYVCGSYDGGTPAFEAWLGKYNVNGTKQWQRYLSTTLSEQPANHGVATDSSGNVYMALQFTDGVYPDLAICKYNSSGSIQWQRKITQYSQIYATAVTTDSSDNVYVLSYANGVGAGSYDWFIAKWNSSGTIQWQRALGTTAADYAFGIRIYGDNMYICGRTSGAGAGSDDIMIAKLPTDGSLTGTYGSFVYQATSLTEAAGSLTEGAASLSTSGVGGSHSNGTLTDATTSFTATVTSF